MSRQPNRMFFALWPDETTRAACDAAARRLRARLQPGGRPERAERLHATLLFLGDDVPANEEAAAHEAAGKLRSRPFTLTLDRAGSFPRRRSLWWLGCQQTPPEALALSDGLRAALRIAGVRYDLKAFTPHVSILRDAGQALAPTPIEPIAWPVRAFVLVRSRLDVQPAQYHVVSQWPLTIEKSDRSGHGQLEIWENDNR
jgi:RNA 2',3'-cyclic 3'-phosphodiesterase